MTRTEQENITAILRNLNDEQLEALEKVFLIMKQDRKRGQRIIAKAERLALGDQA